MSSVTPRMRFLASVLKVMKIEEKLCFSVFFTIERVLVKGIYRKNKKAKSYFLTIVIRNSIFLKNKKTKFLNSRIQYIRKITYFKENYNTYNAKMH